MNACEGKDAQADREKQVHQIFVNVALQSEGGRCPRGLSLKGQRGSIPGHSLPPARAEVEEREVSAWS